MVWERRPFFWGRKPPKKKGSGGRPEPTSAVMAAQGPGMTETGMRAEMVARMSGYPGSEIAGVPASVTRAMWQPECMRWRSDGMRFFSLCSWRLMRGVEMLW